MGCAGSKPDPNELLCFQQISDQLPLISNARVSAGFLELQTRAVKGSMLTSAFGAKPQKAPTVIAFDKVEGDQMIQTAMDVWSCPPRDAMATFFDASETAAAVLVDYGFEFGKDENGAILYARDAPDLSNGKTAIDILKDINGLVMFRVPASKTTVDGVVMHAVCRIKLAGIHTFQARYEAYFLGADGTINSTTDMIFDETDVFCGKVKNGKGETVAYRTIAGKQYFVAAGVDAVLVLALTAMADLGKKRSTRGQGAGGGGGM